MPIVITGATLSADLTVRGLVHVPSVRIESQSPQCARPCPLPEGVVSLIPGAVREGRRG